MSLNLDKSAWKHVALGDVVRNVNVTTKDPAGEGIDRIIAMEHLDPSELRIARWGRVAEGSTFTRRVRPGQTLFGKRRAYQRKAALAEFDAICSGDILVFEADPDQLLPEFLPFIVQSDGFYAHALGTSAGSLSPRTNWRDLSGYELDLPPLGEQKRIAGLMWALERHRESARLLAAAYDRAAAAFRAAVFSVEGCARLDEFVDVQLGQQRAPQHAEGAHVRPYVRAANIGRQGLDMHDVKEMNFAPRDWAKFRLREGDVLVTEGCGSVKELGNSAVWADSEGYPEMFFQKTLLRLRPKGDGASPSLLREWALWAQESGKFASVANGTGILHITAVRCASLPYPRLGGDEVVERSRQFDSLSAGRAAQLTEIEQLGALRSAILADVLGGAG